MNKSSSPPAHVVGQPAGERERAARDAERAKELQDFSDNHCRGHDDCHLPHAAIDRAIQLLLAAPQPAGELLREARNYVEWSAADRHLAGSERVEAKKLLARIDRSLASHPEAPRVVARCRKCGEPVGSEHQSWCEYAKDSSALHPGVLPHQGAHPEAPQPPAQEPNFAAGELIAVRAELDDAYADRDRLRESRDRLVLEATDYLHAVKMLFDVQPEGDCLAERKPSKDGDAYRAFVYLNDQGKLLRDAILAASPPHVQPGREEAHCVGERKA